jgi:hypothetical protein
MTNQEKITFRKFLVDIMLPKDSIGESLNGGIRYAIQQIQGMKTEESEQQEACRWIPVTERLPEEKEDYITHDYVDYQVTMKISKTERVRCCKFGDGHWRHGAIIMDEFITAWREQPEPYKEEQNE